MRRITCFFLLFLFLVVLLKPVAALSKETGETVTLPAASRESEISLEEALSKRQSTRSFADEPLTLKQLSQLLWACQGITHGREFRTAPSAGALYPLEVYALVGDVEGLSPGLYKYDIGKHNLIRVKERDQRGSFSEAVYQPTIIKQAPLTLIISAVYKRTTVKYGERGIRYVHMEVGHAGQNVMLQATALGLGCVGIGAFDDDFVKDFLRSKEEAPLYIIPIGRPIR
jgi:SagB-type dehydrogenase family enzyme